MGIFRDFLRHFLEVFIDNFAIFNERDQILELLRTTFQRCRETGLKLHPGKCFLGMESGILLGHVVSRKGLEVDIDKVGAILVLLVPTYVREVQGFLGCVRYYKRLIEGYAKQATPLKICTLEWLMFDLLQESLLPFLPSFSMLDWWSSQPIRMWPMHLHAF